MAGGNVIGDSSGFSQSVPMGKLLYKPADGNYQSLIIWLAVLVRWIILTNQSLHHWMIGSPGNVRRITFNMLSRCLRSMLRKSG